MIKRSLLLYVFVREGKYDYEPMAHFHGVLRKSKTVHTTLTPGPSPACRARGGNKPEIGNQEKWQLPAYI